METNPIDPMMTIEPEVEISIGLLGATVKLLRANLGDQFPLVVEARMEEIERRILAIEAAIK